MWVQWTEGDSKVFELESLSHDQGLDSITGSEGQTRASGHGDGLEAERSEMVDLGGPHLW